MGMGNDGIELSNSLESYEDQLNNSRLRGVNSVKRSGGDDMPTENAMGNIMGWNGIDSTPSGASGDFPNAPDDSGLMNNGTTELSKKEDHSDQAAKTSATDSAEEKREEKENENGSLSDDTEVPPAKSEPDSDVTSKNSLSVECRAVESVKTNVDVEGPPDLDCQTGPPQTPFYRNESLLRVSYLKRHWGGKRVSDIRSVSELIETFYSLEEPIIIPLPRQRDYYNQWARIPRCDVVQRLYPRANNGNMTSKYWSLFQAIQNDQGKSNAAQSPAPSPQKLAPPPNNEVTCKSLDSIIDHYNQMLHHQQAEVTSAVSATTASTLAQRMAPSKSRANSGSSRSSSSSGNRGSVTSSNAQKQSVSNNIGTRHKISPVPSRKVKGDNQNCDSSPSQKLTDAASLGITNARVKKNPFPDYEMNHDPVLSTVEVFDISTAQSFGQTPPRRMSDHLDLSYDRNEAKSPSRTNVPSCLLVPMSARESRATASSPQPDCNDPERALGDQFGRDAARNVYGINTNTLSLSLPYERAQTEAEILSPSSNSNGLNKSKLASSAYEEISCQKTKAPEKHERFPLRSTAFISRSKRATTTLDIGYSKTRLKNLTRTIPPTSHNIQNLRDSLLIQEIICDGDNNNNDQRKWDPAFKRRGSSTSKSQQSLQHECRPMLPVRVHSMLEQHLHTPAPPPGDNLSPEILRTSSRANSAVSLASVHFLDLADLKNFLKKSNTTITHL